MGRDTPRLSYKGVFHTQHATTKNFSVCMDNQLLRSLHKHLHYILPDQSSSVSAIPDSLFSFPNRSLPPVLCLKKVENLQQLLVFLQQKRVKKNGHKELAQKYNYTTYSYSRYVMCVMCMCVYVWAGECIMYESVHECIQTMLTGCVGSQHEWKNYTVSILCRG